LLMEIILLESFIFSKFLISIKEK